MVSYILFLIARTVSILIMPFGIIYTLISRIDNFRAIGRYFFNIAYALDVLVNVICGDMLNDMWQDEGYSYGSPYDSISKAMGKNKIENTDTWFGRKVANFLNCIDKDHVEKAANK